MKRKRFRESLIDIEFDVSYFVNMFDANSHYYEDVFNDIVNSIGNTYDIIGTYDSLNDLPEDYEDLVEICRDDYNITGAGNGSYTGNRQQAYNYIFCSNDDSFCLLCQLASGHAEDEILRAGAEGNFEGLDCFIREELCYPIIQWIYDNIDLDSEIEDAEIESEDEDYDEGFNDIEESLKKKGWR